MNRLAPAERLRLAFELCDLAERMQRERLRRRFPSESSRALERRLDAWYRERPGAEHGDANDARS